RGVHNTRTNDPEEENMTGGSKWSSLLVISLAGILAETAAAGAATQPAGFVYAATNNPTANAIIQFSRGTDGSLTKMAQVPTGGRGGTGNGAGSLDPLGSQDSLVLSGDGTLLLAVNAGSNQLSALRAGADGLKALSIVSSGGVFPNSVALSG